MTQETKDIMIDLIERITIADNRLYEIKMELTKNSGKLFRIVCEEDDCPTEIYNAVAGLTTDIDNLVKQMEEKEIRSTTNLTEKVVKMKIILPSKIKV